MDFEVFLAVDPGVCALGATSGSWGFPCPQLSSDLGFWTLVLKAVAPQVFRDLWKSIGARRRSDPAAPQEAEPLPPGLPDTWHFPIYSTCGHVTAHSRPCWAVPWQCHPQTQRQELTLGANHFSPHTAHCAKSIPARAVCEPAMAAGTGTGQTRKGRQDGDREVLPLPCHQQHGADQSPKYGIWL